MKKKKAVITGFIFLSLLLVILGIKEKKDGNSESYSPKFVFIAPKEWNRIASGAIQADEDFHTSTKYILYNQNEENKQAEAIQYAWMAGADGIITAGMTDSQDTEQMIQKVQEAGVPVVFVDSDQKKSSRNCYFGCNNYEVGHLAGEALKEITNKNANVCLIVSYLDNTNQQERKKGLEDALADTPGIQIVSVIEGKSEALLIRERLTEMLQSHPEINAIVCAEGVSVNCCSQILEGNHLDSQDYHIVGMHYSEFNLEDLRNGIYDALVWQDQYQMGYEAVKYLKEFQEGKQSDETTHYTELLLLSSEEMDERALWQQEAVEWHIF